MPRSKGAEATWLFQNLCKGSGLLCKLKVMPGERSSMAGGWLELTNRGVERCSLRAGPAMDAVSLPGALAQFRLIRDRLIDSRFSYDFMVGRLLLEFNVNPYAPLQQERSFISCLFVALAMGIGAHVRLGTNWS